jgi:hypothetical protein
LDLFHKVTAPLAVVDDNGQPTGETIGPLMSAEAALMLLDLPDIDSAQPKQRPGLRKGRK